MRYADDGDAGQAAGCAAGKAVTLTTVTVTVTATATAMPWLLQTACLL